MKKNILFVTKFIPAPAYGGGLKRNYAWIKFLSKYYNIDIIGYWNKDFGDSHKRELDCYCSNIYGFNFKRTKLSLIKIAFKSIYKRNAITNLQYYNKDFERKIDNLCKTKKYEFVFFAELATTQYSHTIRNTPYIFDDHNVEYELISRTADYSPFPINLLLKRDSKLMKKIEYNALKNSKKNFFVSKRDLLMFDKIKITNKSIVVNNTYEDRLNNKIYLTSNPSIIFVGSVSWKPNKHGLLHFINNIYSKIYAKCPDISLSIVGSSIGNEIKEFDNKSNINIYENASEELKNSLIDSSWLCIVPVYFGSGTRIKILEYWSHGKVVVSTSIGAEGLPNSAGTFIVDDDDQTVNEILNIIEDKNKLKKLGMKNYSIFKKNYEEEVVYENSLYNTIITK